MSLSDRLDAAIDAALSDKRIVGTTIMAAHRGELTYSRAAGFADREAGIPAQTDTIYRLASLSKLFMACTTLSLADQGRIDLDAPIADYLPWFTPKLPDGTQPDIFIHQLLTHAGGVGSDLTLTDAEHDLASIKAAGGDSWHTSLEDNMRRLATRPLVYAPGTGWQYGSSIDLLGQVASQIVGGTVQDAVAENVTNLLGLKDTAFYPVDPVRLAVPYGDAQPEPERMGEPHGVRGNWGDVTLFSPGRIFDEKAWQAAGGGMAGSASDFLKLVTTIQSGGDPILEPDTVFSGMLNRIGTVPRKSVYGGTGFGFFGEVVDGTTAKPTPLSQGSIAWGGIFGNAWFMDPAAGWACVMLTNTGLEGFSGQFPTDIINAIYGG